MSGPAERSGISGILFPIAGVLNRDVSADAGDDAPGNTILRRRQELSNRVAIHRKDAVTGSQPRFPRRTTYIHPTNGRSIVIVVDRVPDSPNDDCETERQQKAEKRAGESHNNLVQ